MRIKIETYKRNLPRQWTIHEMLFYFSWFGNKNHKKKKLDPSCFPIISTKKSYKLFSQLRRKQNELRNRPCSPDKDTYFVQTTKMAKMANINTNNPPPSNRPCSRSQDIFCWCTRGFEWSLLMALPYRSHFASSLGQGYLCCCHIVFLWHHYMFIKFSFSL